jgi:hypothetical protein
LAARHPTSSAKDAPKLTLAMNYQKNPHGLIKTPQASDRVTTVPMQRHQRLREETP